MKLSARGFEQLEREEGLRTDAYQDAGGVWTIGIGCTTYEDGAAVKPGDSISRQRAVELARWHVERIEADIARLVQVSLTQPQWDALVLFAFNVGTDVDADDKAEGLGDSTLLRKLNAGDYAGAAAEFERWINVAGQPSAALLARRRRERALFETQGPPVAVPERAPDASPAPTPAPIEERSTIDPESGKDRQMLPAVAWALAQAAATAVPAVAKILFDPAKPVAQRNVEAAGAVLGTIVEATRPADAAVWTEQQAVEKVTSDPAAAAAAQAALLDDYDRLVGIIQRGMEADDASREKAAERATRERWDMLPFLADRAFRLIASALAIEVGLLAIGFVTHVSNEALMILLTLLVGTLNKLGDRWGQLYDYRIGSSEGSKASGEAVRAIAARRN